MAQHNRGEDREKLLADVAEMYYLEGRTQSEVGRVVGLTRSAVSRILTEARQRGIVEIRVHRPLQYDGLLEEALKSRFNVQGVRVLLWEEEGQYDKLRNLLGKVAAQTLTGLLAPEIVLGIAWGTTISATIDALEVSEPIAMNIVQLVGVLGSSNLIYNAQALVERLARKVGGEGIYLYTPFIVENANMARSLLSTQDIRETIDIGKKADIALLGIGTTDPKFSSLYRGGHISLEMLESLQSVGVVGDVSAHHFTISGEAPDTDFHSRLVGIARDDLLAIPTRLGVAGGIAKAEAILGALRGEYVNILVTDSQTAAKVLELDLMIDRSS
jgi:DNA-binding transcriptional regulator LsrR (DeoR family)